jgi:hypothetical protein
MNIKIETITLPMLKGTAEDYPNGGLFKVIQATQTDLVYVDKHSNWSMMVAPWAQALGNFVVEEEISDPEVNIFETKDNMVTEDALLKVVAMLANKEALADLL